MIEIKGTDSPTLIAEMRPAAAGAPGLTAELASLTESVARRAPLLMSGRSGRAARAWAAHAQAHAFAATNKGARDDA